MTKCTKHPRYRAMRKPRALCAECWEMWREAQKPREYTIADLIKRLQGFYEQFEDAATIRVLGVSGPVTRVDIDPDGRLIIE